MFYAVSLPRTETGVLCADSFVKPLSSLNAFYRILSRNITARQKENQFFNKLIMGIKYKRNIHRQRKADYSHIYKRCPACHVVLRLPRRKGKHTTVCPKCNKEFKVYVFKA